MKKFKLTIEMLPKGAWNNDFSKPQGLTFTI